MRSAYAAVRAEIGPRGYDDRIYKRKAMATPAVHALNTEAERLLTLRETHRLTGIPPRPERVGLDPEPLTALRPPLSVLGVVVLVSTAGIPGHPGALRPPAGPRYGN